MEKNAPKKKKRLTPLDIILYCISAALLIGGVALIIRQYVLISDYVDPPQPSITPTAVPTPMATPNPSETPAPTAEPTPTPYQYTRSAPKKIYFIDAQVMAEVYPVGLIEEGDKKGQMDTIEDPDVAAWYEPGPAPGEQGNALVNGHKSWKGKIGRFSVLYFRVTSVDFYPYNDYPESVMDMESDTAKMTLITCYGDFDRSAGTSEQRCVVVCELITDGTENEPAAE